MYNNLKAILLSAGYGTRLRPETLKKPKCLIELNKKTMLEIWLEKLSRLGCSEVLINTHYLSEQIEIFLSKYRSSNMKISISYEKNLLGTAGTLMNNLEFIENDTLLIHSDNFTTSNLHGLIKAHKNKSKQCLLTMLTFRTNAPKNCGIVDINREGVVQKFYEKVNNPPSNLANGAIYIFNRELTNWLKLQNRQLTDFSNDVLPYLTGKIQTWHTTEFFIDIGTPESLKVARTFTSN